MGHKHLAIVVLTLVSTATFLSDLRADEAVEFAAGEILLKFKEGASEEQKQSIFKRYSLSKIQLNPTIHTYLVLAKEEDVTAKVAQLNQESLVEYAQPNYVKKRTSLQMILIIHLNGIFRISACQQPGANLPAQP